MKLSVLLAVLVVSTVWAQPDPDTLWTRTYGGELPDRAYCIDETHDGGFIIAGKTENFPYGIYLVMINSQAETLWTRTYNEPDNCIYSIQQTVDGEFIMAGSFSASGTGGHDFFIMKTDNRGDTLWTRRFGGDCDDVAYSVKETSEGGYIAVGYYKRPISYMFCDSDDIYIVKLDPGGDTEWTIILEDPNDDIAYDVQQTSDGGYVIAGTKGSPGNKDYYLVKTNGLGDTLWTRTYGGTAIDRCYALDHTSDGGYVLSGKTTRSGIWIVKTDSNGDTIWTARNEYGAYNEVISIYQMSDEGYIIGGIASMGVGSVQYFLVRTNSQGDTIWARNYGGNYFDICEEILPTRDGGYVMVGLTEIAHPGDIYYYVVKTGPDSYNFPQIAVSLDTLDFGVVTVGEQVEHLLHIYNQGDAPLVLYDVQSTNASFSTNYNSLDSLIYPGDRLSILVAFSPEDTITYNETLSILNNDELVEIALLGTGGILGAGEEPASTIPESYTLHPVYPNPFNAMAVIKYEVPVQGIVRVGVYDVLGRKVATLVDGQVGAGSHQVTWDAGELPSGIYFVQMSARIPMGTAGDFRQVRKVVLLK